MDYLSQKGVRSVSAVCLDTCNGYLRTLAGYSFKTVEQNVCAIRHFLRYLQETGMVSANLASEIHMPAVSKKSKIPSVWATEELQALLHAVDRTSPIGKRDYAMILLACILGLRVSDIKNLRFGNFDWDNKKLSIIQHKTHTEQQKQLKATVFFTKDCGFFHALKLETIGRTRNGNETLRD